MSITTEVSKTGVLVRFPKDREMISALKKAFPRARWNPTAVAWLVEGTTAEKRVAKWIEQQAEAKTSAAANEAAAAAEAVANPIRSAYVTKWNVGWCVRTPYSAEIVSLLRSIPSAEFHRVEKGGYWQVPFRATETLRSVLSRIEALADAIMADRAEEQRRHDATNARLKAEYAAERQAREAARITRQKNRFVVMLDNLPHTGKPVRLYKRVVVVESFGKTFYVDDNMPSMWGSHLLGHEGEACCYAYYREATPDEVVSLEQQEQASAVRAEKIRSAHEEMRKLEQIARTSGEYPQGNHQLNGETLLETERNLRLYGGGRWWIATQDGLWFVTNNGADGDAWDRNNVLTGGAGAIGYRLPRDSRMEDQLRKISAILGKS